jgi:hypothetical protein
VAGGLALLVAVALLAFFYPRRPGYAAVSKERPVNVLHDEEDGDGSHQALPHSYAPEPFLVPDPSIGGASGAPMTPAGGPQMLASMTATGTNPRKSAPPGQMRPVNIIQHDDAGPSEGLASIDEPETIELPPAYTNIRSVQRSPGPAPIDASSSTDSETTDSSRPLYRNPLRT